VLEREAPKSWARELERDETAFPHALWQPEQKRQHLPAIAEGREKWAIRFTGPGGGTDVLGALRTRGRRVDGGWVINGQKTWARCPTSPITETPHPVLAFVGAQRGLGVSVAELFALFGTAMAEGPLLTDCELDLSGEPRVGVEYAVSGEVLAAERKTGRQLGAFDLVTARFSLAVAETGEPVATVTNTYASRRQE
jgi:hypothetical protein